MMSLETLLLLQGLLFQTTLDGSKPDFEEMAVKVLAARRELAQEIEAVVESSLTDAAEQLDKIAAEQLDKTKPSK